MCRIFCCCLVLVVVGWCFSGGFGFFVVVFVNADVL